MPLWLPFVGLGASWAVLSLLGRWRWLLACYRYLRDSVYIKLTPGRRREWSREDVCD